MNKPLRQWRWGRLPVYNGFTHEERVRGWQRIWWLVDTGQLPRPAVCCISGSTKQVAYHSENYFSDDVYPLCQEVHFALHQRFNRPVPWLEILRRYSVTGNEWFALVEMRPVDVAVGLRPI